MFTMKKIKFIVLSTLLVVMLGCTSNENSSEIEEFQKKQNYQSKTAIGSLNQFEDSIQNIDSKIEALLSMLEAKREQISFLTAKKDSILKSSEQTTISLEQVKSQKINPGIEGVNLKLDELKGKKENLQEQQKLQKQEVILAEKKIELQKEEKEVYLAQRKALWDKGAPPADFIKVDSLLVGIDKYLNEQTLKLKSLNRKISDIDEQVKTIDQQRNSLSNKIRNNYTAQKIYEEYSAEEKVRLDSQLISVEEQLNTLLNEQEDLNSDLAIYSGNKSYLQIKQGELNSIQTGENAQLEKLALAQKQAEIEKISRNRRLFNALIGISIAALVLFVLYYVGKKRRTRKTKNNIK